MVASIIKHPHIDAILWDFGGVITSSPFEAFARYEAQRGLPKNFIRTVNTHNPNDNAWAKLERSEINAEEFSTAFQREAVTLGHDVPGSAVLALLDGEVRERMVTALATLKPLYKIACLTNNVRSGHGPAMNRSAKRAEKVASVMSLFELVVESSKVGVRKPEPGFYLSACESLNIDPKRAIYLDDLGINLKPARAMGMRTIKVVDPDMALQTLSELLGHNVLPDSA